MAQEVEINRLKKIYTRLVLMEESQADYSNNKFNFKIKRDIT